MKKLAIIFFLFLVVWIGLWIMFPLVMIAVNLIIFAWSWHEMKNAPIIPDNVDI